MATKKKGSTHDTVIEVETSEPRVVTPGNPLNITTSPVSYDQVWIDGGDINVTVETTVTFAELKKVS